MAGTDTDNKKTIIERSEDGTIELKIKVPWAVVKKQWDIVLEEMVKNADLPGFRKGKAPRKLVEERLDKGKIRDEVLRHILPPAYVEAVKEHNLRPIMDPRIHLEGELAEGQDWEFHAVTSEAPQITIDGYKDAVKKVTAKSKIVVPGKETEQPKFDEIIKALMDSSKATIPNILVEREVDRLLSQTLDEIKRLGMTLEQYLSSTGKTAEQLRNEYREKALSDLKLEFVLQKVSETEKISVEDAEIEKTIENAKPEEKESLRANKYLLASIIRQQKTLDFLKNL
jgi:FKBP-type peptidyl-prolyl cis-trans isomerase (trigger factor)